MPAAIEVNGRGQGSGERRCPTTRAERRGVAPTPCPIPTRGYAGRKGNVTGSKMQNKRTGVYSREQLMRLLHPQSVAVIGASTRAGSFGERVLFNMQFYNGRHYPVNGRYETIGEARCYPTVLELPEVPDCAVITAPREAVEEIVLDCAKAGVGGAIIFASGYSETAKEDRIAQQERLAAIARETGLRIIGPNCIGVVNALLDCRVTFMNITPIPQPKPACSRDHQPVRCAGHGAGAGCRSRVVGQPRADVRQLVRRRYGRLRQLPGRRAILQGDRLRVRGHGNTRTAVAGGGERLGAGQAAGDLQDGDRRAGRAGGNVAHRLARGLAGGLPRGVPARRRGAGG